MKIPPTERIWHRYEAWECVAAGMYSDPEPLDIDSGREAYRAFLADLELFGASMRNVFERWPISCEHFLTNEQINRIAWIGQASACISAGLPRVYRGGFHLLSREQQAAANAVAEGGLIGWIRKHNKDLRGVHSAVGAARIHGRHTGRGSEADSGRAIGSVLQGNLFGDSSE